MKKFIFILTILTSICSADSNAIKKSHLNLKQDEHGLFFIDDSQKPYTGKSTSYYSNRLKFEESTYEDGVLRKYFSWDKNGKKRSVKTFETDGVLKDHIIWYSNGHKSYEEYYIDHMNNSVIASWNPQGQKLSETHYSAGVLNGLVTSWYENGQKSHEEKWVNGARVGPILRWKRNGTKIP